MKKDILTVLKKLTVIATAAVLLICLSACGKKEAKEGGPKTFIDVLDDGSVVANFDKTEKGTGGGSGITIEEGEYLIIETALTEGEVQVRVVRGGSDIDALPTKETDTPKEAEAAGDLADNIHIEDDGVYVDTFVNVALDEINE